MAACWALGLGFRSHTRLTKSIGLLYSVSVGGQDHTVAIQGSEYTIMPGPHKDYMGNRSGLYTGYIRTTFDRNNLRECIGIDLQRDCAGIRLPWKLI